MPINPQQFRRFNPFAQMQPVQPNVSPLLQATPVAVDPSMQVEDGARRFRELLAMQAPEQVAPGPPPRIAPTPMRPAVEQLAAPDVEQSYLDWATRQPKEEQFAHPGKLARLAAILSGASESLQGRPGGPALTRAMLQEPYERAMAGWKAEGEALRPLAEIAKWQTMEETRRYGIDVRSYDYGQLRDMKERIATELQTETNARKRAELQMRWETVKAELDSREYTASEREATARYGIESANWRARWEGIVSLDREALRGGWNIKVAQWETLKPTDRTIQMSQVAHEVAQLDPRYDKFLDKGWQTSVLPPRVKGWDEIEAETPKSQRALTRTEFEQFTSAVMDRAPTGVIQIPTADLDETFVQDIDPKTGQPIGEKRGGLIQPPPPPITGAGVSTGAGPTTRRGGRVPPPTPSPPAPAPTVRPKRIAPGVDLKIFPRR